MKTEISTDEATKQLIKSTGFDLLVCKDLVDRLEEIAVDDPDYCFNPHYIAITFTSLTKRELIESYYTAFNSSSFGGFKGSDLPSDYVEFVLNSDNLFYDFLEFIEDNAGAYPRLSIVESGNDTLYSFKAF